MSQTADPAPQSPPPLPPQDFWRGIGVAALGGVVLTLTGAFGTGESPLWLRGSYWIFVMVAGGLWGHAAGMMVDRVVDLYERPWLTVAVQTAVISGPMVAFVWLATGLTFEGRIYDLDVLPELILPVVTVTSAVSAVNVFLGRGRTVQTHAVVRAEVPTTARFLDRLPPRLRGARLIAVQSEDHYLRLHTDRGADLILMRLADAVAELDGLEGAQTHRSWWVSRDAVRDVDRGDGRATLTLDGGLTVPVSRRHARALRAAGWW
jgi:DNA-binding LytR/AlgR family response regulator